VVAEIDAPPENTPMQFHASVSDHDTAAEAVGQVIDDALDATGGVVDVAFLFFTGHHLPDIERAVERVWLELDPQAVVGCSAEGVIGGEREIERSAGMSLLVGSMPDVRVHPFHVNADDWRELLAEDSRDALAERLGCGPETRALIGFGDPFTTPLAQFLAAVDATAPGVPLVGGMASAGRSAGGNMLVRNDDLFDDGFVGLSLSGPLDVQAVVSQGCRPVGRPAVVTKARENVIEQLGGRPAMQVLREIVDTMSPPEQELLRRGLFIGQAISEYRESFGRGDFLVRNVTGVDEATGAIEVAEYVRPGRTVQFHVRDAETADEDLTVLLDAQRTQPVPPAGALLFSCNGRGTRLFDDAGHDVGAARKAMPAAPVAGFFAAGELGPVGGRNFVHGHTASLAIFRPR
jgi:small ligand-binding sensory domain FIST